MGPVDRGPSHEAAGGEGSPVIYTVGHSDHPIQQFISLLVGQRMTALVDVRSWPYSRRHPQFDRESLAESLRSAGIAYVFMGHELGGRPDDPGSYENGLVSYERRAARPAFKQGLSRLLRGAESHRIVLLCAEREPMECHRTLLVGRALSELGVRVEHILPDGSTEAQPEIERRLLKLAGLQLSLFDARPSDDERLNLAYSLQARKVASRQHREARPVGGGE